nr:chemotaxis response regulator protein-glutamate methylesterase [Desulfovibrio cuneatus]
MLIVDDSLFIRRTLKMLLEKETDIEIVGMAADGMQALEMVTSLDPDLITMDVEMPRMDGITALKRIMEEAPTPVIMISSLTTEGADVTFKALDIGALDYIAKPASGSLDIVALQQELASRVRALARRKALMRLIHRSKSRNAQPGSASPAMGSTGTGAKMSTIDSSRPAAPERPTFVERGTFSDRGTSTTHTLGHEPSQASAARSSSPVAGGGEVPVRFGRAPFDVVCIGVSTGGPPAVQKVLSSLPGNFPVPLLIAQHMPMSFTGPFAKRLDGQCAIQVEEIAETVRLKPGTAYVCRGGMHLRLEMRGGVLFGVVGEEPKSALYKPSANELMASAGNALGKRALCVILTGMGNDGLEGTKVLKAKGGFAIAQNEASCVVYGMPKAIVDAKLADEIVDIDHMGPTILSHFTR